MIFADKIAIANRVACQLIDTERSLDQEIAEAGHADLVRDEDLLRLIGERVVLCPACERWEATPLRETYEPGDPCDSCALDDGDYD